MAYQQVPNSVRNGYIIMESESALGRAGYQLIPLTNSSPGISVDELLGLSVLAGRDELVMAIGGLGMS